VFLTVMVIGLVGLVVMALPALGLGGHHHLPPMHGHGPAHLPGHASGHGPAEGAGQTILATTTHGPLRFLPSPRAVFSVCALYGAFGNALVHAAHLGHGAAALLAIVPAFLVERLLVRPVWNLLFRFQARASSPLEELILAEAQAVVPFRNGRGVIATVRDGRRVQLTARLRDEDAAKPVVFGQRLRIEDVDARRERVTVSVIAPNATTTPST
jgi:hypothetical protein